MLAAIGLANAVLDPVGYKLAISVIVLSLLFSPIWTRAVKQAHVATQQRIGSLKVAFFSQAGPDNENATKGRNRAPLGGPQVEKEREKT